MLESLSDDLLLEVFERLQTVHKLKSIRMVSKRWNKLANVSIGRDRRMLQRARDRAKDRARERERDVLDVEQYVANR